MPSPPEPRTVVVVGIAGGTGSGKTTFARALRDALPRGTVGLVDHDSYYHDLTHLPFDERKQVNFDHPDALDNELLATHLEALGAGRAIEKPCYDFASHTRRPDVQRVDATPIVIVEGILVLADARVRAHLDLKLYVDAPADRRLLRRIRRDIVERGRDIDGVAAQYERTVRPMHDRFVEPSRAHADLIVSGLGDASAALRIAADALRHRLRLA